MYFPPSELVLNSKGQVYHLGVSADQVADTIILVGDQERVAMVSSFFQTIDHTSAHREFVCHTGIYNGKRISVLSTGIGTDNIDITISELDALANINLSTRNVHPTLKRLKLVRIGTCGILQSEIPLHSYLISSFAIGLDNIAHFYEVEQSTSEVNLLTRFTQDVDLPKNIKPYAIAATNSLREQLESENTFTGITVTSSGFYGPQGRQLRLGTKTTELNDQLTNFKWEDHRIVNFEMESSALFALGRSMGHECATICLGVGNRPNLEFSTGYHDEMMHMIQYVLDRI